MSTTLSPAFKLIFGTVLLLTLASLAVSLFLILADERSRQALGLIRTTTTTYKIGFGAIAGLLGGKFT